MLLRILHHFVEAVEAVEVLPWRPVRERVLRACVGRLVVVVEEDAECGAPFGAPPGAGREAVNEAGAQRAGIAEPYFDVFNVSDFLSNSITRLDN